MKIIQSVEDSRNNNRVLISVITASYNGGRYIENCLKSVIRQHCSYVEHIIIDGASTDNTLNILNNYSKKYGHIHWISEKDAGQSDAMNKGIQMSRGNIIGVLNVDDYYEPGILNRILTYFNELPDPSLLVGNCNIINSEGEIVFINKPKRLKIEELLLGSTINPHPVNPSAYFYHKSLHNKIGAYNKDEHYIMDLHFIFKAVQKAHVKYVDETWGNYRYIQGTKTWIDYDLGLGKKRQKDLHRFYYNQLGIYQKIQVLKLKYIYRYQAILSSLYKIGRILRSYIFSCFRHS